MAAVPSGYRALNPVSTAGARSWLGKAVGHSMAYRGPGTYVKLAKAAVKPPKPPGTPPVAGVPGAATAPAAPNPYDSTYYGQLSQAQLGEQNRENAINLSSGYARTDLQNTLGNYARQQPLDTQKAQEAANRQGLLYSGHLGQTLGQLNQNYLDRQTQAQTGYARGQAGRDAAVAALRQGLSLQQAALAAAAVERASVSAQKDPTLSQSNTTTKYGQVQGHSAAFQGPGVYRGGGAQNPLLRAQGHSSRYRGAGRYTY